MRTPIRRWGRLLARLPSAALVGLIRVYQVAISPLTPQSCRYYPSCSAYARVALQRHGLWAGMWLAARRLLSCHPWCTGGVDEVPETRPRLFRRWRDTHTSETR